MYEDRNPDDELIKMTVRIRRAVYEKAIRAKKRHGDLSRMVENGLENEADKILQPENKQFELQAS